MKKMTLLVVTTVAFLMVATTAFAIGPAYIPWNAGGANAGTNGPHQNYRLTTEKCAVCHSVHAAAVAGAPAGEFGPNAVTSAQTQLLLRGSVADACTYCHIDTNTSGLQIYGGISSQYTASDVYGHNGSTSAECADCHAVHGADTFKGQVSGKILKANLNGVANTSGNVQTEAAATLNAVVAPATVFNVTGAANQELQVTAFCTRCHKTFSDQSETTVTASGYFSNYNAVVSFGAKSYKNHPMKAFESNFETTTSGANYNGQVAWANSNTCRDCHAAGLTNQATSSGGGGGIVVSSFPHYTPARANFLTSGWGINDLNATPVAPGGNTVLDGAEDGVCLRCHTNGSALGNATQGVGVTF